LLMLSTALKTKKLSRTSPFNLWIPWKTWDNLCMQ
jgi:hypothetical protein